MRFCFYPFLLATRVVAFVLLFPLRMLSYALRNSIGSLVLRECTFFEFLFCPIDLLFGLPDFLIQYVAIFLGDEAAILFSLLSPKRRRPRRGAFYLGEVLRVGLDGKPQKTWYGSLIEAGRGLYVTYRQATSLVAHGSPGSFKSAFFTRLLYEQMRTGNCICGFFDEAAKDPEIFRILAALARRLGYTVHYFSDSREPSHAVNPLAALKALVEWLYTYGDTLVTLLGVGEGAAKFWEGRGRTAIVAPMKSLQETEDFEVEEFVSS